MPRRYTMTEPSAASVRARFADRPAASGPTGKGPKTSRIASSVSRPRRRLPFVLALLCVALTSGAAAAAGGVLERIAADGVMRAGTRASGGAFAHATAGGGFAGFSVDLLEEIRLGAQRMLGRDIALELFSVTPADRLVRVAEGELDIVCGLTTPTRERERLVDFSLPFFRDGTRIVTYRAHASRIADVNGLEIGVVEGTTTVSVIENRLPLVGTRVFADIGAAMDAFANGDVHGVANIGSALLSEAERARLDRSVVLLPRTSVLETEPLACVLPQNDSPWRDMVNSVLADLLVGIGSHTSRYEDIHDRWFGRAGLLHLPLDRETRHYLANVSIWVR